MQLSDNFLVELYKYSLISQPFLEIANKNLQYHFLPSEPYKRVWKEIVTIYELFSKLPTIGVLAERLKDEPSETLDLLKQIKQCDVGDKKDMIISEFEFFLKRVMFVDLYGRVGKLYNDGKKDDAILLMAEESEKIAAFSIKGSKYIRVFTDFESRQSQRK